MAPFEVISKVFSEVSSGAFFLPTSQPKTIVGCTEFTLFPKLPLELRLLVWKATFPQQRIIMLKFRASSSTNTSSSRNPGFWSSACLPKALGISKESRQETLKHYQQVFGNVCINFQTDVLYIPGNILVSPPLSFGGAWQSPFAFLCSKYAKDLAKVELVALHWIDCEKLSSRRKPEMLGKYFPALKEAFWSRGGHSVPRILGDLIGDSTVVTTEKGLETSKWEVSEASVERWNKILGLDLVAGYVGDSGKRLGLESRDA